MNLPLLENSPLFTPWRDPVSGVESLILTSRAAPLQQSFYFTNISLAAGGRYLWFYASFPPGGDAYYGRQLAVADLVEQTVQSFPETAFMDASPWVDPETAEVFWTTGLEVWKRSPVPSAQAVQVNVFPEDLARQRRPLRLATHLSRSADGTSFAIDAQIGDEWFVGDLPLDGSPFRLWQTFDRCYNHAQFSPRDPDLMLLAQDFWTDPSDGKKGQAEDRLWLLRRGGEAQPVMANDPSHMRGHEWWDPEGLHIWYVHYQTGVEKVHLLTGEITLVWPGDVTHAHADRTGRYLVGDRVLSPEVWDVAFFNAETGRAISIASQLPPLTMPRSRYHVHPHPQFCADDQYICSTTNVLGRVDVAFTRVSDLIEGTR